MSGKKQKLSKPMEGSKETEKVPLHVWIARAVRENKLQVWQEKEIRTFFKEKGLTELEEPDKYTELLKLY